MFIDDLISAFDAFLNSSDPISGKVFNIGGGPDNTLSLLELLEILEKLSKKRSEIKYSDWRPSDQKVYISNISKAEEKLGWSPRIGPEKGVKMLVSWILENESLFK